jgi:hypothetical protein
MSTEPETGKRRLRDLTAPQRALLVALGLVQIGLLVAALVDLSRRPARKVRGDKRLWVAAAFVNYAGPLAYFAYGRKR